MTKYEIALEADKNYSGELAKVYGKDSCNARYDYKRNKATPMLKALAEYKEAADKNLFNN